jgi:hypothetical protein
LSANIDSSQYLERRSHERQDLSRLAGRDRHCRRTIEQWAQVIRSDDLHMLIVPEIGMDQTTAQLAPLWLAPLQATSWGHSDTSGLPTMDYCLSSDLMELAGAEAGYSETLVRLPNIGFYYIPRPIRASSIHARGHRAAARRCRLLVLPILCEISPPVVIAHLG